MGKVERILTLFFRLYSGQRISKLSFCFEMKITSRTFERDMEDLRTFLSDAFLGYEILFDHVTNVYFMTGRERRELTDVEFTTAATILIGSKALRKDEMEGLICQLYRITSDKKTVPWLMIEQEMCRYPKEIHQKAMLKTQWDLSQCISRHKVITIQYEREERFDRITVIPLQLYYVDRNLYLKSVDVEKEEEEILRIDKIESFKIIRSQTKKEIERWHKDTKEDDI